MRIKFTKILCISIFAMFLCFSEAPVSAQTTLSGGIMKNDNINQLYTEYTKYIEYCIRLSLQYNNIKGLHNFSMQITVEDNGNISAYGILGSSDDENYDKLAIGAVLDAAPFKPIPQDLNRSRITYQVNIYGGNVSVSSYSDAFDLEYSVKPKETERKIVDIAEAKSTRTMYYFPYYVPFQVKRSINRQIKQNWYPPMQVNSAVGVSFRIHTDGTIDRIKIFKSTDFDASNDAAIDAVKSIKLEPWKPYKSKKQTFANVKYGFHVDNYMH